MDIQAFIANIPKAELHVHLEGTLEPSLMRILAAKNHVPLPPSLTAMEGSSYAFHDLTSFLAVYYPAMSVLLTSSDFHDLAYAYLFKCRAQHIVHAEIFFDPQAHTSRGVPFPVVISGIRSAIVKAHAEWGMSASLVLCILRDQSQAFAMATLMEALPYKEWIVGIGLDSDERGNPPAKFASVFARARQEGWLLTAHCDIDQERSVEHIRQCVHDIGVDRIDHGTNTIENEELVQEIVKRGIGLTCCPLSNSVVTNGFKGKEMKQLMGKGVKITINSDDPAYFKGYMAENLVLMHERAGMNWRDIMQLQRNAFDISWISEQKREGFLKMLEEFLTHSSASD